MTMVAPAPAGVPVYPMRDPYGLAMEITRSERAEVLRGRGYTDEPRPSVPLPTPRDVDISVAVAHAPWSTERRANISTYGFSFELIEDTHGEGCWPTVRRAWEAASGTHHLVMTDDLTLPTGFVDALQQCVSLFPDSPITLMSVTNGARVAWLSGYRWALSWGVLGAATVLPRHMAEGFLDWERDNIVPECPHDDVRITAYLTVQGLGVLTPLPCLVEHGSFGSILPGYEGAEHGRASAFVRDVRGIDWSERADVPVFIGASVERPEAWFTDGRTLEEVRNGR